MSQRPQPYPGTTPCRFLLVQGVGKYDFVKEE